MQPGSYNLVTTRGDTFRKTFTFYDNAGDDTPGDPINFTGFTGAAQIRSTEDGTLVATLSVTIVDQTTNPGRVDVLGASSETAKLDGLQFVWDLQLTNGSGEVFTYLKGKVLNTLDVTRAS